jgi:hypothetical protein
MNGFGVVTVNTVPELGVITMTLLPPMTSEVHGPRGEGTVTGCVKVTRAVKEVSLTTLEICGAGVSDLGDDTKRGR